MIKKYLALLCLLLPQLALSQDLSKARQTIELLSDKAMWGRGYTKGGMARAAEFIVSELQSYGLTPLNGKDFRQNFSMPINTFPGKMSASINGRNLIPGKDFIVLAESSGKTGSGKLKQIDSATFSDPDQRMLVILKDKLTWSASMQQADYTGIQLDKKNINGIPSDYTIAIENVFSRLFKRPISVDLSRESENPTLCSSLPRIMTIWAEWAAKPIFLVPMIMPVV